MPQSAARVERDSESAPEVIGLPDLLGRVLGAFAQTTTYLGLAMIGCIWLGVALLSEENRRRAVENGLREGGNLARILEQYTSNVVGGVDSALLVLREEYERRPERFDIRRAIDRAKLQNDLIIQFAIAGANGISTHSSLGPIQGTVDATDREFFRVHAEGMSDLLFISQPVTGRVTGKSSIQLTRRLRGSDGSFGGIIVASLDLLKLERFFNSIDVGTRGVVSLVGRDGVIRASSGPESAAGERAGRSTSYARILENPDRAPVGGYWSVPHSERRPDDVRRLVSYRLVDGLPLVAVVALAEADVFAQAASEAANYRRIGLALTVFVLVVIGFGAVRQLQLISAAEALERSKASVERTNLLFDTALGNISQGLCMFDGEARLLICNRRYVDMYRLSPAIVKPGCSLREVMQHRKDLGIPIDDVDQHCRDILDNLAHGTSRPRYVETPDGRIILALNHPIPGGGWVSVHQDITEHRLAEGRLEEANRQLSTQQWAIDQAIMVSMTDADGRIVYVNDNFCKVSGYDRAELIGQTHRIFRSGVHSREFYRELHRRIEGGEAWRGEICSRTKDGTLVWADTAIVPRMDQDGKPSAYMAIRVDITARKQAEVQIAYLARHDPLTGLANRAVFLEATEKALSRLRRFGHQFSVMMIDLDHFKNVNDMLGHGAGDDLLKVVGQRLQDNVRDTDVVARLGGDEFALLSFGEGEPRESALILANRLLGCVTTTYDLKGQEAVIGASIGIALASERNLEAGELLKCADIALYKVKSEGRNGVCIFDGALEDEARSRAQLVVDLWKGLSRDEFELFYQPIVDVATRKVRAMEALVRWRHPRRGLVPPADFIPLAESSGAIVALGDWILRRACRDAASWPSGIKVAVNLSPAQFKKGNLVEAVTGALLDSGLAADRLKLEITESVLIQNDEANFALLHQLRSLDVSIVLDDFGTGYSSLGYLRMFPFDLIKIDQSFVREMSSKADSAAIVCAVVGLARSLDIGTIAEGVETGEQLELLRAAGCRQAQGYLFARPLPVGELRFEVGTVDAVNVGGGEAAA